jgi:hypothetical protein
MEPVRHCIGKLALILTLAVAALLLPSSLAHAWQGHGGGHAGLGGSGHPTHHGHRPHSGGSGGTWGGYYPYWGYDTFYGDSYGYVYGNSYGYGIYSGNDPYLGVYTPAWGVSPVTPSTTYQFVDIMSLFP